MATTKKRAKGRNESEHAGTPTGTSRPKPKRRKHHPGVVIIKPEPERRIGWRLRYTDPDTGKMVKESIPEAEARRADTREDAAVRKFQEISRRKVELEELGAVRKTGEPLSDAIKAYFKAHHQRERTTAIYGRVARKLLAWAERHGIEKADELNRKRLFQFREHLINQPKHAPVTGKKVGRGKWAPTSERRSAVAVNQDLRAIGTVLRYLVDRESLAKVSHDDLRRALKQLDVERDVADYLKPAELQRLFEAAMRHDAETVVSREDERALRRDAQRRGITRAKLQELDQPKGTTPKYEPVAPFVAFVLLSGMRLGEAVDLDWNQVDLEALDDHGNRVGEITLRGDGTKTRKGRVVGLEVSPALRSLLVAMRLRSGGQGRVFPSRAAVVAAGKRLASTYGAPEGFTWQALRRTCATFLVNSPGIFAGSAPYRSAKALGHSVVIAERDYQGLVRGISPDARDLETAMQIRDEVARVVDSVSGERTAVGQVLAMGSGRSRVAE